jgi:iron-sulfur cluster assembly accessory protein
MMTLTDKAIEAIRGVCAGHGLRVQVRQACAGTTYALTLAERAEPDDLVVDRAGVRVLLDPASALWLAGARLDCVDDPALGPSLVFDRPDRPTPGAAKGCACARKSCG